MQVKQFYAYWEAFNTVRTCAGADKYDTRAAPNRQVRTPHCRGEWLYAGVSHCGLGVAAGFLVDSRHRIVWVGC